MLSIVAAAVVAQEAAKAKKFADPASSNPSQGRFPAGDIAVNHMFVEYQIPKDRKHRYPVIMMQVEGWIKKHVPNVAGR